MKTLLNIVGNVFGVIFIIGTGLFSYCACVLNSRFKEDEEVIEMGNISEEEWNTMSAKILKAVESIETTNQRESIIKMAVMVYLYKSLESEEVFNNNCEILDNVRYEEVRSRKLGK